MASPNPGIRDSLEDINVTSAANAWAVGSWSNSTADQTLVLHWNGRKWHRVTSPDVGGPGNDNLLDGVTATSGRNAWAVGSAASGTGDKALILRWDGAKWARVASPNPGTSSDLNGVAASSATSVWAVGAFDGAIRRTLAIHCC